MMSQRPTPKPSGRDKSGWYVDHDNDVEITNTSTAGILVIGDSLVKGLERYPKIWNRYFESMNSLNFSIRGDRTENVLWRVENTNICKYFVNYYEPCTFFLNENVEIAITCFLCHVTLLKLVHVQIFSLVAVFPDCF